jgi:hypothetical protein
MEIRVFTEKRISNYKIRINVELIIKVILIRSYKFD